MRAQVTVEFILLLVIMLTMFATVSIPLVNYVTDTISDTSIAINLGASVQRIRNTAEEVALMGCGSYKNITVYVESDPLAQSNIRWNSTYIWGDYYDNKGEKQILSKVAIPDYIKISSGCPIALNTYEIRIEKDCTSQNPTQEGVIGYEEAIK
ncbi:MAG: hypothetical protein J7K68_03225 [Candidatus Diapherotrites archaeon]|nr:hypothetical protein [Candidatus Diapherotrites archaeon]